jgi:hypothetical protein
MNKEFKIKITELGKPIFKAKGNKKEVKQEVDDFWDMKGL